VVVVWAVDQPRCITLALRDGALEVGRDDLAAAGVPDGRVSRRHVRVEHDGARWSVHDQQSRNGTFVDGRRVRSAPGLVAPVVVRIGRTLLLPVSDRRPFESAGVVVRDGAVMGPSVQAAHAWIAAAARGGTNLLVLGESGVGKELAAGAFHAAAGAANRPFVAVNCATIPTALAEATLFGARRGAFTGAVADTTGLFQSADGGTLFLDEIAELDLTVQAKLLRALETRRITPVGAVDSVSVQIRLCAATHKDLRAEVVAGRFREDLYFRLARPRVLLPPLRERREEIPWLVARALAAAPPGGSSARASSAEFVESCMLRPWPGNVRELLAEAHIAAIAAAARGETAVGSTDLDEEAGRTLDATVHEGSAASEEPVGAAMPERAAVEAALRAERGNVARAAEQLGISRSRLRRFLEREGLDPRALREE
jgi:DNA-binding NtrC family response regulator